MFELAFASSVRFISAAIVGIVSRFFVYMIPAMLLEETAISKLFVTATFLSGFAITFLIVIKGVQNSPEVWARGSLVWASEWVVAGIVPIYVSRLALTESAAHIAENLQAKEIAQGEAWRAASIGIGFCLFNGRRVVFALGAAIILSILTQLHHLN